MKKFCVTVYLFALSLMVFAMSGCGGNSGGDVKLNQQSQSQTQEEQQTTTQSAQSRTMVIKSPALKRNGKYSLFRGNKVGTTLATPTKYYAAPASAVSRGSETLVMNLEYTSAVSEDLPFVITESDDYTVIFAYNPDGTGTDTTSTGVLRSGGGTQKLKYTNLTLTGASVELEESEGIIDIVLKSDGTATAGGTSIPVYDYIWHADPQHPAEYWTLSGDSTELDSDAYEEAIESAGTNNGLYIAHDVRYTSNTLNFTASNTATKDEDREYVVYYDFTQEAVREGLAANLAKYNLGSEYSSDKYIFATLPMSNGGMGGAPGGNMPSGDMPGGGTMPSGDRPGGNPPSAPGSDTRLPVMGSFTAAADSSIATFATMTHSAADAYANPVLHITEPGTYRLSGTWKGQIWIDVGKNSDDVVGLILSGVNVECTVAPALVFYKVYKWAEDNGYDDQSTLAENNLWRNIGDKMLSGDYYVNGAIVEVADGTTNTFTGANTYRILELCPKLTDSGDTEVPKYTGSGIGTDISEQEKMYKFDAAFQSRRTMVIGGGSAGTGTLNITSSTYEGLGSEMHLLINGGNINVTAPDDAVNVNEDYVSVFQMDSGTMTISSTNADGIDSNGWIAINGGTVNITAGNTRIGSAGESGIDAENGYYISPNATYNWTAASGSGGGNQNPSGGTTSGDQSGSTGGTTSGDQSGSTGGTTSGDQSGSTGPGTTVKTLTVTPTTEYVGDATFTLFPADGTLEVDTEGERTIPSSSATFELQHRVNDFAGITAN